MSERKRAKRALENYQRQELNNAFRDVQVSTLGSDLMRDENARNMSTATDTIVQAGDRSIVGGLPKIVAQTNLANQEARKYLDDQAIKREYAIASDEQQIRAMKEARDNANISALSSQFNSANQNMWNGLKGLGSAVSDGMSMYSQAKMNDSRRNLFDLQAEAIKKHNDTLGNNGASTKAPFSSYGSPIEVVIPPNFTQDPNYMMNYDDYIQKYGDPFKPLV